jgi:hypothetical protein
MSSVPAPRTDRMAESDLVTEFRFGEPALDDFFRKHALSNDERSIGRTYVLRRRGDEPATLPAVLGFYTLSMSTIASSLVTALVGEQGRPPHRAGLNDSRPGGAIKVARPPRGGGLSPPSSG